MSAHDVVYLTPEGRHALEEELRVIREEQLPELAPVVRDLADEGDTSDDTEWDVSRDELLGLYQRRDELEHILNVAEEVPPPTAEGVVRIGARVTVETADGEQLTWLLVDPIELGLTEDRISVDSPVGLALINREIGESVTAHTPDGDVTYRIIAVN